MKSYSNEEKNRVLNLYSHGNSVAEIVARTKISRSTIYSWIKTNQLAQKEFTLREFHLLQKKVTRLETMVQILQSIDCTAQAPLKIKLDVLEELHSQYPVHIICDALQVSRGTFYNHIFRNKRTNAWYEKRRIELGDEIQKIFDETGQIYGSKKIAALLKQKGIHTSDKTVRSIMKERGLASVKIDAKDYYDKEQKPYKNYLNQRFEVSRPNEVWVSDITVFKLKNKTYNICVILDLYARRVIAYHISERQSTQLITKTFKKAWEKRQPIEKLLFHSDRGGQYDSNTFRQLLISYGVKQSFSRAHVPYDNSVMESFFSTLKKEKLYRQNYSSEKEFKKSVEEFMYFYNEKRPHGKINYKTPCEKEEEYWKRVSKN